MVEILLLRKETRKPKATLGSGAEGAFRQETCNLF